MNGLRFGENLYFKRPNELSQEELAWWHKQVSADEDLRRAFLSSAYVLRLAETNANLRVLVHTGNQGPRFILPLQRTNGVLGRLGIFEPPGREMTDYFGAVAEPGVQINIESVLNATEGRINAILFSHLDESQTKFGLGGDEQRVGLRIRLPARPEDYWCNLRKTDKKLVYDTERREKKFLTEVGPLRFEWASLTPEADISWLIEAKRSQYVRTGKDSAPLFHRENAELLLSLLGSSSEQCRGQLSVLRSGERIVAAHFGLRCHEVLHVWFPVYEVSYSQYSPGRILFRNMFSAAAEAGVQMFDRGEGDNQAKRDFATEEHRFARGLWLASGVRGVLARAALGLAWRIDQWKSASAPTARP
jgi:CelD/BcsL family acetyltransferase involved in cellulose biosynthesis